VRLEEPSWWYGEAPGVRAQLLAPLGALYGWIAQRRYQRRQPYRSRFPVICVGNFTAGGTGKTPLAIAVARLLAARGVAPVFLTRGYGGSDAGPAWVEDGPGAARRFGDEPLLLARVAPTMVARDRAAGARAIESSGRHVGAIVTDDGLQNGSLAKDLSIAVVDGARGLGNGEVIPAGPLRAPIEFQLGLVDAIVVREPEEDGAAAAGVHERMRRSFPGPVLAARVVAASGDGAWLSGKPVVAFAGIANPERFFALAEKLGAHVLERVTFPDHHAFSRADAERLLRVAQSKACDLVTTEKDWARLVGDESLGELARRTRPLGIEMVFDDRDRGRIVSLIEAATLNQSYPRTRPPQP
jgi:tetraacyldisaccharide 4'-kinase